MVMASIYTFSIKLLTRSYHKYIVVWNKLVVGEDLLCEREVGNSHDMQAVAVKKVIDGN